MSIQSCFATMTLIDLLTKFTTLSHPDTLYTTWCKIVTPLIYGALVVNID